jgi:hypothetical protein
MMADTGMFCFALSAPEQNKLSIPFPPNLSIEEFPYGQSTGRVWGGGKGVKPGVKASFAGVLMFPLLRT